MLPLCNSNTLVLAHGYGSPKELIQKFCLEFVYLQINVYLQFLKAQSRHHKLKWLEIMSTMFFFYIASKRNDINLNTIHFEINVPYCSHYLHHCILLLDHTLNVFGALSRIPRLRWCRMLVEDGCGYHYVHRIHHFCSMRR